MSKLIWDGVRELARHKATLHTKTNKPFQMITASNNTLIIKVSSGREYTISRSNLELAVEKINTGVVLGSPLDYRNLIADERPAYAWAILKELGFLSKEPLS